MASNEAVHMKQESPLNGKLGISYALNTRGSEDSGNTTVAVCYHRGTTSEQVLDTEESNDKDRRTQIPI